MYQQILEQRAAISAVLLDSGRARALILSPEEITQLEQLLVVLEPLAHATEYLAVDKKPCLKYSRFLLPFVRSI